MKYIFWIHSSTAYYTSKAVVKLNKIPKADIIFFTDRGYQNKYDDNEFNSVDVRNIASLFQKITVLKMLRMPIYIKKVDKQISLLLRDESFFLYIPQMTSPIFQVLVTNKLCVGYSFVEEGFANYKVNLYSESPNSFPKVFSMFFSVYNVFHKRIELNHPFLAPYRKTHLKPKYYLLRNQYHHATDDTILVDWEIERNILRLPTESHVMILSPLVEYNLADYDNFFYAIRILCNRIMNSGASTVYLKFHPYQNENVKRDVMSCLQTQNIHNCVLSSDEPFEQILLSSEKLNLYGFESSLLFYATVFRRNHKVYSANRLLSQKDKNYNMHIQKIDYTLFKDFIQL